MTVSPLGVATDLSNENKLFSTLRIKCRNEFNFTSNVLCWDIQHKDFVKISMWRKRERERGREREGEKKEGGSKDTEPMFPVHASHHLWLFGRMGEF